MSCPFDKGNNMSPELRDMIKKFYSLHDELDVFELLGLSREIIIGLIIVAEDLGGERDLLCRQLGRISIIIEEGLSENNQIKR